jgi:hypothetical protein
MPSRNHLIAIIAITCIVVTVKPIVAQEKNDYGLDDEITPPPARRAPVVPLAPQINKDYPAILRAPPLEEGVGDDDLRRLQKSRYNSAVTEVLASMKLYEEGLGQGLIALELVTRATTHLTEAALDMESDPRKRIKILEDVLAIHTHREAIVEQRTSGGVDNFGAYHHVRCERLAAEIALMKAHRAQKGDAPVMAEDSEDFEIERAKRPISYVLPRRDSSLPKIVYAAPLAEEASDDDLRKLQKARYNSAIAEVSACMSVYEAGLGQGSQSFIAVLRAALGVAEAALDMESDPKRRIAILEDALTVHACREKVFEERTRSGVEDRYAYLHARCERLAAEIALIKARQALKVDEPFGAEDEADFGIDRAEPPPAKRPITPLAPQGDENDRETPAPPKPRARLLENAPFPKILRAKPLIDEKSDDNLRKLQKARYNSAIAEVAACKFIHDVGLGSKSSSMDALAQATTHFADAAIDLESDASKRIAILEDVHELYVWLEDNTAGMTRNGVDNAALYHRSRRERLAADIRLFKARHALDVAKPPVALHRARSDVDRAEPVLREFTQAKEAIPKGLSLSEIVRAEPLKEEAGDDELRKLQKAHFNSAVAEMSACILVYEQGLGQGSNALEMAMQSAICVTEAALDMETNPQKQIKILEVQLAVFKLREVEIEARAKGGIDSMNLFHHARCDRLACEARVLRAQRALKPTRGRKK